MFRDLLTGSSKERLFTWGGARAKKDCERTLGGVGASSGWRGRWAMRDLSLLKTLGRDLDFRPAGAVLRGPYGFPHECGVAPQQMRDYLIAGLLKIRSKKGGLVRLAPNWAQME